MRSWEHRRYNGTSGVLRFSTTVIRTRVVDILSSNRVPTQDFLGLLSCLNSQCLSFKFLSPIHLVTYLSSYLQAATFLRESVAEKPGFAEYAGRAEE